jgi:Abnormal spindle-like microcephaly-assoc'd, ASPM-SPD-2-Hydin/Beta-propeller repeat
LNSIRFRFSWCAALCTVSLITGVAWAVLRHSVDRPKGAPVAAIAMTSTLHSAPQPSPSIGPAPAVRAQTAENYGKLPVSFEANRGQADQRVKFLSRGRGYTLFLTADEVVLKLQKPSPTPSARTTDPAALLHNEDMGIESEHTASTKSQPAMDDVPTTLRMKLVGANRTAELSGGEELPGKSNYFIGNDPKKWLSNVPTYSKVKYREAYPGVDLVYYGNQQQLEYDFVVAPGSSPEAITLDLGVDSLPATRDQGIQNAHPLRIAGNGDLVLSTGGGELRFKKPVVYQEGAARDSRQTSDKQFVEGKWVLKSGNRVGFAVPSYDSRKTLVIDPAISYSTYLGGSAGDVSQAISVDASGNAYVTGVATSTDFPTVNPVQATYHGNQDAFVTKLNASGSALVYSTYLGGSGSDGGFGIAVDAAGNAYVGGDTGSKDFPITAGAFQTVCGGGCFHGTTDVFLAKLDSSGSTLVYSTYIGGTNTDRLIEGVAVDAAGHAYITGWTTSTDFPTTPGAFQTTLRGTSAGFVAEFNATGSGLVYSTLLGGSAAGVVSAISLDSAGDAYLTGWTSSTDFPVTSGAFQSTLGGGSDAFVSKLNPTGTGLLYSTYLGGSGNDIAYGIAVNALGDVYIAGFTCSPNYPTTIGVFQTSYASASCTAWGGNGFVTEMNSTGSALVYSTFLGGSGNDVVFGLALDKSGNVHLTGRTNSKNYPLTPGAFQTTYGGAIDAFVTELNPLGSKLVYSTYLGGSLSDAGYVIQLDSAGNSYLTGRTYSTNFPVTPGSFQSSLPGTFSAMVVKMVAGDQVWPMALNFGSQAVGVTSAPLTTTLTNSGTSTLTITGASLSGTNASDFAQSNNCGAGLVAGASCTVSVTFTPPATGAFNATLLITDNANNSPQTVALSGTGIVSGLVSLTPGSMTFSTQLVGTTSAPQPATLSNTGTAPVTISNIATSGPYNQTNNCASTLAPSASCTINVAFQPTAPGTKTGSLAVTDDAPGSPQTVALTGTGTVISLSPASLSFGNQAQGTSSTPQSVTVKNVGSASVTIGKISFAGSRATSYSQTNTCGSTLAAGASCTISVVFTPKLKGALTASLNVFDTGGGSPQSVALSGTGI